MSCLFDAFSFFINDSSYINRQKICNFLLYKSIYDPNVLVIQHITDANQTPETYVQNMRNTNVWGGALEMYAFCNLYKYHLKVYVEKTQTWIEFLPDDGIYRKTIKICWNGGHFEPCKKFV